MDVIHLSKVFQKDKITQKVTQKLQFDPCDSREPSPSLLLFYP